MKPLTQKQIKNMIRLLVAGKPGPNIDAVILIEANWWKDQGDKKWKADIKDAEYLCLWLNKLLNIKDPYRTSRLDHWIVQHGYAKDTDEIRKDYKKWQRTQRAMLDWMANELRKELRKKVKEKNCYPVCPPCNQDCNEGRDCPARREK